MSYLCSVFPEKVGRKADGKCGGKVRKGPQAGSAVRNARMAEGTEGGRLVHPAEMPGIPPNTQLCSACDDEVEDLKYEPSRCPSDMAFRLKAN